MKRRIPKKDFVEGGPTRLWMEKGVKVNSLIPAVIIR